jgi:anti-sigma B factor antagonist
MDQRASFGVELIVPAAGQAVVAVTGEVDIYTAPRVQEVLLGSIEDGATHVVVDLSEVPFIDSTGLGVVVRAVQKLRKKHGALDIVCPNERVRRTFEVTGLTSVLGIHESREEALDSTRTG